MTSALEGPFLWGAATAAHQVEGGNVNSDCWALEHASPSLFAEPSLDAVDQYHRFAEDIALVASLGLNAYRFSIEWARVEPEPGRFSAAVLDHYARVTAACAEHGLAAVATLHHFTGPRWLARLGGFAASDFPQRFAAYAERVAKNVPGLSAVCTINELNLPVSAGQYFRQLATPQLRAAAETALGAPLESFFLFARDEDILGNGLRAHAAAREAMHAARPGLPVGMTLAISEEDAEPGAEALRDERRERLYAPFLDAAAGDGFLGVQTYSRNLMRQDGRAGIAPGATATTMGWEDRPQAIGAVLAWIASRWPVPLLVTENGYPGSDDARRCAFIDEALGGVARAIAGGADVGGYFYWSLMDNFEWMFGYRQRFGLVGVDRSTFQREIKASARRLGEWARKGHWSSSPCAGRL